MVTDRSRLLPLSHQRAYSEISGLRVVAAGYKTEASACLSLVVTTATATFLVRELIPYSHVLNTTFTLVQPQAAFRMREEGH